MAKPLICYLFIFSLLFMGVESAVDLAGGGHPHSDDYVHHVADNGDMEVHEDGAHCSHCCHGHAGTIYSHMHDASCHFAGQTFAHYHPSVRHLPQKPPTPPPNA